MRHAPTAGALIALLLLAGLPIPTSGASSTEFAEVVQILGDDALQAWASAHNLPGSGAVDDPIRLTGCAFEKGLHLKGVQRHLEISGCLFGPGQGHPNVIPARSTASLLIEQTSNLTVTTSHFASGFMAIYSRDIVLANNTLAGSLPLALKHFGDSSISGNQIDTGLVEAYLIYRTDIIGNQGNLPRLHLNQVESVVLAGNTLARAQLQLRDVMSIQVDDNEVDSSYFVDSTFGNPGCSWSCTYPGDEAFDREPFEASISYFRNNHIHSTWRDGPVLACSWYGYTLDGPGSMGLIMDGNVVPPGAAVSIRDCGNVKFSNTTLTGAGKLLKVTLSFNITLSDLALEGATAEIWGVDSLDFQRNHLRSPVAPDERPHYIIYAPLLDLRGAQDARISHNTFEGGWQSMGIRRENYVGSRETSDIVVHTNVFDAAANSILLGDQAAYENVTIYNNHLDALHHNIHPIGGVPGVAWSIPPTRGTNVIGGPFLGGNQWCSFWGWDLDADGLADAGSKAFAIPPDPLAGYAYGPGDMHPLVPWIVSDPQGALKVATAQRAPGCDHTDLIDSD